LYDEQECRAFVHNDFEALNGDKCYNVDYGEHGALAYRSTSEYGPTISVHDIRDMSPSSKDNKPASVEQERATRATDDGNKIDYIWQCSGPHHVRRAR
jgi:hypothetical protein